jgi:hypothetical protein
MPKNRLTLAVIVKGHHHGSCQRRCMAKPMVEKKVMGRKEGAKKKVEGGKSIL